jgi:hypothetical protein
MSHEQKAGKYHNIKIGYKSFENMENLKYLGTLKNKKLNF